MLRFCVLFIACVLCACQSSPNPAASFYYWKTTFKLATEEATILTENDVDHLYIRYFDVVLENGVAVPESPVVFAEVPDRLRVIPVVYIKNEVMLRHNADAEDLADKVVSFIEKINRNYGLTTSELQIDCDSSEKSKSTYFRFLELIRSKSNVLLSATIRLHQIKYFERTGIPPVDKGVLMYYNMGRISADGSNSIYERSTAARYLDRLSEYPLSLDVALPVFGWGVHIRNDKVIGLIRDVDMETFRSDDRFEMLSETLFESKVSMFKMGSRFLQGDRVKMESVTRADLGEMSRDIKVKIKNIPSEVIFYDLDKFNLKQFENENQVFQKISADF